jgi:tRNA threonylcarbamoyladenosine biosynthesis protein TsaE
MQVTLHSEEDTRCLAERLAPGLRPGVTVGLRGELGAGKTTLVRHLVKALGGLPEHVSSPSFTLQHEYTLSGGTVLEHWDLYRVRSAPPEVLEPPGKSVIRIIEWPERIDEVLLQLDVEVALSVADSGERLASIRSSSALKVQGCGE